MMQNEDSALHGHDLGTFTAQAIEMKLTAVPHNDGFENQLHGYSKE